MVSFVIARLKISWGCILIELSLGSCHHTLLTMILRRTVAQGGLALFRPWSCWGIIWRFSGLTLSSRRGYRGCMWILVTLLGFWNFTWRLTRLWGYAWRFYELLLLDASWSWGWEYRGSQWGKWKQLTVCRGKFPTGSEWGLYRLINLELLRLRFWRGECGCNHSGKGWAWSDVGS